MTTRNKLRYGKIEPKNFAKRSNPQVPNGLLVLPGKNADRFEHRSAISRGGIQISPFMMINDGALGNITQNLILLPLSLKAKMKNCEPWECSCEIDCQNVYLSYDDILLRDLTGAALINKPTYVRFTQNYSTSTCDFEEMIVKGLFRCQGVLDKKLLKKIIQLRRHDGRCLDGLEKHSHFEFQEVPRPVRTCCDTF